MKDFEVSFQKHFPDSYVHDTSLQIIAADCIKVEALLENWGLHNIEEQKMFDIMKCNFI